MNSGFRIQMLFSPQNCDLEILDKTLTPDYRTLANNLLRRIRNKKGGSHHELIIGPRGSGKTHILAFIYKTLKKADPDEKELKVITLSEEERGLTSLLDFLLACLRNCDLHPDEITQNVMTGDAVTALEAAENMFEKQTDNVPTKIFAENLSDIFKGFKTNDLLDLRGFFQTRSNISLIASSVSLYKSSSNPDHPFYGFFNIHPLEPLDRKKTRLFMATLADVNNKNELAQELRKAQSQVKVNAIYDLTGGNHRLLSMLANVLDVKGLAELVGPFVQMIDRELTPYYQLRLSSLSSQKNKILRAIADHHGKAITVKEIAFFTILASQVVSRQLHDLYQGMFIRRTKKGRESYYELNEPLLRIVLDMKEGRDRPLPLIVSFLKYWYVKKELRQLEKDAPEYVRAYYHEALIGVQRIERAVTLKKQIGVSDEITIDASEAKIDDRVADKQLKEVERLIEKAHSYNQLGQNLKSISVLDTIIEKFGDSNKPELLVWVARALFNKGVALGELNKPEDAIAIYDEVVQRFGESDLPELLAQVARALFNKGITLGRLNRPKDAIATYDEVVQRFGDSDQPELLEPVARALFNKGITLGRLNRPKDAIAIYDEVVQRFGDSDQPELLEPVVNAHIGSAFIQSTLGNYLEAKVTLERALQIKPDHSVAYAGRIEIFFELGQVDQALVAIVEAFDRFSELSSELAYIFSKQIDRLIKNEVVFKKVIDLFVKKNKESILVEGLISWLKSLLPMSEDEAREMEVAELALNSVFSDVEQVQQVLQVFNAVRQDALGDPKALLSIPLELRRLIEKEKNS